MKITAPARLLLPGMLLAAALAACSQNGDSIRIDGSSVQTAEDSYNRMVDSLPSLGRRQLRVAIRQLNVEGAEQSSQAVSDPGLQHTSAARIRDIINGMNAREIIAASEKSSRTKGSPDLRVKS